MYINVQMDIAFSYMFFMFFCQIFEVSLASQAKCIKSKDFHSLRDSVRNVQHGNPNPKIHTQTHQHQFIPKTTTTKLTYYYSLLFLICVLFYAYFYIKIHKNYWTVLIGKKMKTKTKFIWFVMGNSTIKNNKQKKSTKKHQNSALSPFIWNTKKTFF